MVILLNACSFRSPQSQFYVMNSSDINSLSDKTMNVAINQVKVPEMLDKTQMVVYDKESAEVQILEFHRWAEVLPETPAPYHVTRTPFASSPRTTRRR